ncbi:MAG: pimeloyl-ACP methyl ester carboxylesterase [Motiliproteus sp.]|jgi:pimeloyl-ACP methyl ester carboxylesterase
MSHPATRMSAQRLKIFEQLKLIPYLEQRQILTFTSLPLHAELYHHSDDAPWIIFIPGIGTYSELYCEMLCKLSQQGFNMLSVDLPGHGYSGGPRGAYQIDTLVTQLGEVVDYLEQQYSGAVALFGCSIGSRIGLALAESDSRIKALMCHTLLLKELPPDMFHDMGWQALSMSRWMMPGMTVDFRTFIDIDNILEHNPMGEFARLDSRIVWNYPIATLDSLYGASSNILNQPLGIPAAIIVGEKDDVLPPAYIRRLIAQSAQPFDLFEVSDAAHMLPFDQVDITVNTVSQWMTEALELDTEAQAPSAAVR